jgi:hypothetical protein
MRAIKADPFRPFGADRSAQGFERFFFVDQADLALAPGVTLASWDLGGQPSA